MARDTSASTATVYLESDFEVGPGPAFHVYLVPKASIRSTSDVKDLMSVDLGGLRAFKGSQRYPIPDGVDLKNYQSVIIWCQQFGVLISPADLTTAMAASEALPKMECASCDWTRPACRGSFASAFRAELSPPP